MKRGLALKITLLDVPKTTGLLERSPFGYDRYWEEQSRLTTDEEMWVDDLEYKRVYGGTAQYRPTCSGHDGTLWKDQTFWDPQRLRRTAEAVAAVLDDLGATRDVAAPVDGNSKWFSSSSVWGRWAEPKIQFLRPQGVRGDFWTGRSSASGITSPDRQIHCKRRLRTARINKGGTSISNLKSEIRAIGA